MPLNWRLFGNAVKPADQIVPWRLDLHEARASALKDGKPCVLILHVDSPAL